ncbi:hypothetical protein CP_0767 [Chlamydia pneumoniae AR39]|uniref:Uncharacterized protein n=1 Tax=Chlamydia pneumoniae TaxID=83558 RepID=Q9K1Z2_CHLPN|nr:hypothetical protein CP_0767 [Chlamydia pneumoniae AR39]
MRKRPWNKIIDMSSLVALTYVFEHDDITDS